MNKRKYTMFTMIIIGILSIFEWGISFSSIFFTDKISLSKIQGNPCKISLSSFGFKNIFALAFILIPFKVLQNKFSFRPYLLHFEFHQLYKELRLLLNCMYFQKHESCPVLTKIPFYLQY